MHPGNTTLMPLNQVKVETGNAYSELFFSHHIEDFLIYVSALGSWMTLALYLPHFHGPLVIMAFLRVASLHSCLSFLHPTSLTGIENQLQLIRVSVEGAKFFILN